MQELLFANILVILKCCFDFKKSLDYFSDIEYNLDWIFL